jgi:predicted PurR-regulated permease PerM
MAVLLPIYAWYLLFELERIHGGIRKYVPAPEKERVTRIARQIGSVLTVFFRGRLTVCLVKGLLLTAGLLLVGAPYAVFLGMASGFAALIPFVGAFFGYGFTFLVALTTPDADFWTTFGLVSVVFGVVEAVEGYVLVPRILGDSMGLHPLFVFVSVFIGGATMGMFGFLLALPLAAAGLILVRELVVPAMEQFAAADDELAEGPGNTASDTAPKEPGN